MNENEAYLAGFSKVAEEHGVDPVALAKFAEDYDVRMGASAANDSIEEFNRYMGDVNDLTQGFGDYLRGVGSSLTNGAFRGVSAPIFKNMHSNYGAVAGKLLGHLRNGVVGYNNQAAANNSATTNALVQAYRQIAGKQRLDPNGPVAKALNALNAVRSMRSRVKAPVQSR